MRHAYVHQVGQKSVKIVPCFDLFHNMFVCACYLLIYYQYLMCILFTSVQILRTVYSNLFVKLTCIILKSYIKYPCRHIFSSNSYVELSLLAGTDQSILPKIFKCHGTFSDVAIKFKTFASFPKKVRVNCTKFQ